MSTLRDYEWIFLIIYVLYYCNYLVHILLLSVHILIRHRYSLIFRKCFCFQQTLSTHSLIFIMSWFSDVLDIFRISGRVSCCKNFLCRSHLFFAKKNNHVWFYVLVFGDTNLSRHVVLIYGHLSVNWETFLRKLSWQLFLLI